jgi:hypothetical protein
VLAVARNSQAACAKEYHLSFAKQGALLVVALLCVGSTVGKRIGGAVGNMQIERFAALVIDGGTVGMMDADTIQLYAEFIFPLHQQ